MELIEKQITEIVSQIINKRISLGLTQRDLAKLTGIKQPAIARFETLEVVPRLDTILKIIKPLDIKLELK